MPHRPEVDERFVFSSWDRKATLHAAIIATDQPGKPAGNPLWRFAGGNNVVSAVRCNMGCHIIKIEAIVPGGNTDGTDRALPAEHYICKKETGEWSLKYLTSSEGTHKTNSHLKQASEQDNYSIMSYNQYVPFQVMNAVNDYKTLYYNKYKPANDSLTMYMAL